MDGVAVKRTSVTREELAGVVVAMVAGRVPEWGHGVVSEHDGDHAML